MTTDTTREGFEATCTGDITRHPTRKHRYMDHETQMMWEGHQAAKADELAFLESALEEWATGGAYVRVRHRIAELKGESRG